MSGGYMSGAEDGGTAAAAQKAPVVVEIVGEAAAEGAPLAPQPHQRTRLLPPRGHAEAKRRNGRRDPEESARVAGVRW